MKQNNINDYLNLVRKKIYKKYSRNLKKNYDLSVMNNILEKDKCHIVAIFKEFLLYYDYMEFLKRFYKITESRSRLINISYFYKENLLFFPNYSPLIESRYLHHNIRRKQALKNKIINNKKKMQKMKKNHKEINKENNNKKKGNDSENNFFTNTIYNEILEEGESFIYLLFGMEKKNNKDNENSSIFSQTEIDKEIEDYEKIIDNINDTETKKKKIVNIFTGNNDRSKKIKYIKPNVDDICLSSSIKLDTIKNNINYNNNNNNKKNNKNNNSNSLFIMNNSTASGSQSILNTIQNQKYSVKYKKIINIKPQDLHKNEPIYKKIRISNNVSSRKDIFNNTHNNKINNETEKKQENNIVYHRKVKSTLIGDNSYKLDLPSNLSVVNSLRIANQKFAEKNKDCNVIRVSLYKKIKNRKINNKNPLSNSITRMVDVPNETYNKESIGEILKNIKNQMAKTPYGSGEKEGKGCTVIKLSKNIGNEKKIQMPFIKSPVRTIYSKLKSPKYSRNSIAGMSYNNSIKDINKDININDNNCTTPMNNEPILNTNRRSENVLKHIYINHNMVSPYSKPKGINKDKKYISVSGKKLFGKYYNNVLNEKNDKDV